MEIKKNEIISMSLKPEILEEIDSLTGEMGFSGRSETIRAGIKALVNEKKERQKLKGEINASLIVVHEHAKNMGKIAHEKQEVIVSHLHNHLDNDKCIDIFVLKGDAKKIRMLVEDMQKNKGVEQVKLAVVS